MDTPKVPPGQTSPAGMIRTDNDKTVQSKETEARTRTPSQREVAEKEIPPPKKARTILPKRGASCSASEAPLSREEERRLKDRVISQKYRDKEKNRIAEMEKQLEELTKQNEALEIENKALKEHGQLLTNENQELKEQNTDPLLTKK